MPQVTIKPGKSFSLPPVPPGMTRKLQHDSGPAVTVGSQKMEGSVVEAARNGLVLTLAVSGTVSGLSGTLAIYNAPGGADALVTFTDSAPNAAAAIGAPTAPSASYVQAEAVSAVTAINSLRAALINAGISL